MLDQVYGTNWCKSYFVIQLTRHVSTPDTGFLTLTRFAELLAAVTQWYPLELRFSPVWTALLLLAMVVALARGTLLRSRACALLTLFYFSYMGPLFVAKSKMPHWAVAIYPVAAGLLVLLIPARFTEAIFKRISPAVVNFVAAVILFFLAVVPYPREIREYRGQDWFASAALIQNESTPDLPFLFVVEPEKFEAFGHYSYSSFTLGRKTPMRFGRVESILTGPCRGGLFGVDSEHLKQILTQVTAHGWRRIPGYDRQLVLFHCPPGH